MTRSLQNAPERARPGEVDAVVLGAGISGLVATSVLLQQGATRVLVIDSYPTVGGNHLDVERAGFTFDVGSFIFQDDSPLLRHFPQLMDSYVPISPSWSRLNPQGVVTDYPFSLRDDVLAAGAFGIARILASAVRWRLSRRPMDSARDFARRWIGSYFLRRSGLENYMARFCGCSIDQIDLTFAQSRMMWISEQAGARALVRRVVGLIRRPPQTPPTNRQLVRPRSGFADLYAPAVTALEGRGAEFALGQEVGGIRRAGGGGDGGFEVDHGAETVRAPRVVSTIPIDLVAGMCGIPVAALPSVTLISLFYSFVGVRGFDSSILYNFSHEARWKRLTVYSDFYGATGGREYFAVEVVADASADTTVATAAGEFRDHTRANRLLDGDLRLEGGHVLEHAYPIYTAGSAERARDAVEALAAFGVESFGRQGAYRYQPTARMSTVEAESALGVTAAAG